MPAGGARGNGLANWLREPTRSLAGGGCLPQVVAAFWRPPGGTCHAGHGAMSAILGSTANTLREVNRQRVLVALRDLGTASRADLERATGLSRGTVASMVTELRRDGILRPAGGPDTRSGARG